MQQSLPNGLPAIAAPTFEMIGRERVRPGVWVAAALVMLMVMSGVLWGLKQSGRVQLRFGNGDQGRSAGAAGARGDGNDDDDPNLVDTIVLGDTADAPVPAKKGDHVSPVHATILVKLPRFGDETGLIPDNEAGRRLYDWLAAFNQGNEGALRNVMPGVAEQAIQAQMELRRETGGFALVSAKEARPGVVVFRLRDQTRDAREALGTLQIREDRIPATIGSLSLRGVGGEANTGVPATPE